MAFKKIAVAVEGSTFSNVALLKAAQLAQHLNATLSIIHILEACVDDLLLSKFSTDSYIEEKTELAKQILNAAKHTVSAYSIESEVLLVKNSVDQKRISECLAETVMEIHADILVIGTHGRRGFNALLLGSVAEECIRISPIPVLLIGIQSQSTPRDDYNKIAVAIDGSPSSEFAMLCGISLSKSLKSRLELIHVANEFPAHLPIGFHLAKEQNYLRNQGQMLLDQSSIIAIEKGVATGKHLAEIKSGPKTVSQVLIEEVINIEASLLVMGSHGWSGLNQFVLGSVVAETALMSPIPLLIVSAKK